MSEFYCKNCKYFKIRKAEPLEEEDRCSYSYPECHYWSDKFIADGSYNKSRNPETYNKNNNCQFYERKWWKYWATERVKSISWYPNQ